MHIFGFYVEWIVRHRYLNLGLHQINHVLSAQITNPPFSPDLDAQTLTLSKYEVNVMLFVFVCKVEYLINLGMRSMLSVASFVTYGEVC